MALGALLGLAASSHKENEIGMKRQHWVRIAGIITLAAAILWLMGRSLICKCGTVKFWHGAVASSQNSQHIADWYSFSHVIHGFLFYGLFWLVAKKKPLGWRLTAAVALEAAWEVVENSPSIINRYRSVTMAYDYYGDSILNSVSDIGFMMLGFLIARRLPVQATIALAIMMELFTLAFIRDNLMLNVLMLVWPIEAIRHWQAGG